MSAVPRLLHRVWVGGEPPDWALETGDLLAKLHPDWDIRLWTDADVAAFPLASFARNHHKPHVAVSDVLRAEVLFELGGVYLDCDMHPLRPLDGLTVDPFSRGWVCREDDPGWKLGSVANAAMGLPAGHTLAARVLSHGIVEMAKGECDPVRLWGPLAWSRAVRSSGRDDDPYRVLEPEAFYPWPWRDRALAEAAVTGDLDELAERLPGTYAVHLWRGSWRT